MRSLPGIFLLLALFFAYSKFFERHNSTPAKAPPATVGNRRGPEFTALDDDARQIFSDDCQL